METIPACPDKSRDKPAVVYLLPLPSSGPVGKNKDGQAREISAFSPCPEPET
jgi:hypothetical protein